MRFDGQLYAAKGGEPTWFIEFLASYNRVIRYLVELNSRKFKVGEDVADYSATLPVLDSTDIQINHKLGVLTRRVTANGRVETCVIKDSSPTYVTINCRLISFRLIAGQTGFRNMVIFEDTRQLGTKDTLKFGTQTRNVLYVNGNSVTLDSVVNCDNVTVVPLALDTVSITVI
jgi:hypothetical protein